MTIPEWDQSYVATALAGRPLDVREVAEDREALIGRLGPLEAEPAREKSLQTARVDEDSAASLSPFACGFSRADDVGGTVIALASASYPEMARPC